MVKAPLQIFERDDDPVVACIRETVKQMEQQASGSYLYGAAAATYCGLQNFLVRYDYDRQWEGLGLA